MRKKIGWMVLACTFLGIAVLIFWLMPRASSSKTSALNTQTSSNVVTTPASGDNSSRADPIFASPSQQDTQINCQLNLDPSHHLIVNEQTRNCFEYFITQYGEKELSQIDQDFQRYIQKNYTAPALTQILDLWQRYFKYRQSLADLQTPNVTKESTSYYQSIFNQTQNLRKKHFSDYEIEGLFGNENTYHLYTIQRMSVLEDKNLNEAEKAQKLKQLFNQLPEDWKENLEQLNKLEDLRKLTADIKARGGSAEEIRQMRLSLVGVDATQRLENLDVQRGAWKNRVNDYLSARENIVKSGMSETAKQQSIQELRQQHFNDTAEQRRVETFENLYDQGNALPFAE